MKERICKGEWVTRSSLSNRKERLAQHEEFMQSEFKRMLDDGWEVKKTRVRVRKERPAFKMWGTISVKFDIPVEILIKAGFAK